MGPNEMTLSLDDYMRLLESDMMLTALEKYCIENWEHYDEALSNFLDELDGKELELKAAIREQWEEYILGADEAEIEAYYRRMDSRFSSRRPSPLK